MVEDARQVRRSGDIQAAIASFKAADALKANHPEILSELALSYEALGLADKSQSAWSRVRAMGPEGAGGYYNLAVSKLEGAPQAAATVEQNAVSLGQCSTSKAGNRVVLHVPMTAGEGQSINPDLMDIQIYFFEKADGQRIETAPNSRLGNSRWSAAAPQWAPGKPEVMEIEYVPPTPGSTPSSLEYHGYMVKLYYQDKFMGEQADPPALLKFRSQNEGSGGPENALLPPIK